MNNDYLTEAESERLEKAAERGKLTDGELTTLTNVGVRKTMAWYRAAVGETLNSFPGPEAQRILAETTILFISGMICFDVIKPEDDPGAYLRQCGFDEAIVDEIVRCVGSRVAAYFRKIQGMN